jgi:hypothetical protein
MRSITAAAVLLIAASAHAYDTNDCSRSNYHFNGQQGYVAQQVIEAGNQRSLKLSTSNAPVSIRGGNQSGYTITVCKAAALAANLDAIHVTVEGGELKATGPEGQKWNVSYRILAPRGADMELETKNGPVSVRDYDGSLIARAKNGPLSLNNVSGKIDVTTANGPVKVSGGSGTMKLQASNGPVSVHLTGTQWEGGGLEASTSNGPLTLKLPRGYNSGVVATAEGRGPISCRAAGCERFREALSHTRDRWDGQPRSIELGFGTPVVRLATRNGPLTIREDE